MRSRKRRPSYVQNVGKINEGQPSVKGYRDMHIRLLPIQDPDGFDSLDSICYEFNLEKPMWLDSTVKDFQLHDKTRFTQDKFYSKPLTFDFLEIQVIEE